MTSGGARSNAGRRPRQQLDVLPADGYSGSAPDFPLPDATARETAVWDELWRLPQAHAWSLPAESWRLGTIALYVRQRVKCEAADIGASHLAQLHRFADQIGLTDSGLRLMGYTIAADGAPGAPASRKSSRDRLQVVPKNSMERARQRAEREGA